MYVGVQFVRLLTLGVVWLSGCKILLGCLVFVVLWSSGWIGSKYGQAYAGTLTLLAYRYVLVVLALLVFVSVTRAWRSMPRSQIYLHVCVGLMAHAVFLGAGNSAFAFGVSAGLVAFITALQPMMTATLSPAIAGEKISYRQWSGLVLGFAAVMLVVSDRIALGGSVLGYSLPFIAIVAISVASLIDRRISLANQADNCEQPPLSLITLIHCSSALLFFVVAAAVFEGFESQWSGELVFSILWLAIFVSLGAYGLMFLMLRKLSAVKVASLAYLSPPATMLIGYFVFGERLSTVDFLGLFFAAVSVWLVLSKQSQSASVEPADGQAYGHGTSDAAVPVAAQGLLLSVQAKELLRGGLTLDIDLGEPLLSAFDFPGVRGRRLMGNTATAIQSTTIQQAVELDELIYFRKRQIYRLNQLVFNLQDSKGKIDALLGRGTDTESYVYDSVLDEIELKRACNSLRDLIEHGGVAGDDVEQRTPIFAAGNSRRAI